MDVAKLAEDLCTYDDRNPDGAHTFMDPEDYTRAAVGERCVCDNCFYGRTALAEFILGDGRAEHVQTAEEFTSAVAGLGAIMRAYVSARGLQYQPCDDGLVVFTVHGLADDSFPNERIK